jgi:hypothetical protein
MTCTRSITLSLALLFTAALAFAAPAEPVAPAADDDTAAATTPTTQPSASQQEILDALAPSLVRVEYTLRYDKGEAPQRVWSAGMTADPEETIREERPLEMPGIAIAPDRVLTPDMTIHPRFIESIAVRCGDQVVKASVESIAVERTAQILKLEKPLTDAKPLAVDPEAGDPTFAVAYEHSNGLWVTLIAPIAKALANVETGHKGSPNQGFSIVTDRQGRVAGLDTNGWLPADGSWREPPAKWELISAEELAAKIAETKERLANSVFRVELTFRSPRKSPAFYTPEDEISQLNALGSLVGPRQLAIMSKLDPKLTARLDRIRVYLPDDKIVEAKFAGSLKDYGLMMAELPEALEGAIKLSDARPVDFDDRLLIAAEVRLQGDQRLDYVHYGRIVGYQLGWKRQVYPMVNTGQMTTMLDLDGTVVAMPAMRREKVTMRDRGGYASLQLTAARYVKDVLANLSENLDVANVPLTEDQENRLAWLGVELQPMDPELARLHKVAELTSNGRTGAIVSYVYEGSPADKAGIKAGWVLLRLHFPESPKPMEVQIERYPFSERMFPWEQLDRVSEEYFDRIPRPWPPVENAVTRAMTDYGFGKKFQAEFFHDGKAERKPMVVEQSPPHYDTASRYKAAALGLTVQDLTYEALRYYNLTDKDPGVLPAKIEPGSEASLAGIKPLEIITHVNDKPVLDIADFEKLIQGQAELRLTVKRMNRGRVVKITLDEPIGGAATRPADDQAEDEGNAEEPADDETASASPAEQD